MRRGLVVVFVACLVGAFVAWWVMEKPTPSPSFAPPVPVSLQTLPSVVATAQPSPSTPAPVAAATTDPFSILAAASSGDPEQVADRLALALEIGFADAPVRLAESEALARELRERAAAGTLRARDVLILEEQIIEASSDRRLSDVEVELLADLAYGLTLE